MKNKIVYAFGDSIVYGHTQSDTAFMNIIADEDGIILKKYAVNGATIMKSQKHILAQVEAAPSDKPDAVVFDGYTNDAYEPVMSVLGEIQYGKADELDDSTFCGCFEKTVRAMHEKWKNVPVIFVTIHKSAGRDWDIQCRLRELAIEICKKWNVCVADIFEETVLDTRDAAQMEKYIIDGVGSHPNEAACREFYVPKVREKLKEALDNVE